MESWWTVDQLVEELPYYVQVVNGMHSFVAFFNDLNVRSEVMQRFWQEVKLSLPHWALIKGPLTVRVCREQDISVWLLLCS